MSNPLFLRFIPPAFRQDISRSLNSQYTIDPRVNVFPDGRLTRRNNPPGKTPSNTDLELTLDNLGFGYPLRTLNKPAADRFERITGVEFGPNPQWQTGVKTSDPVLKSRWLATLLKRNRISDQTFDNQTLTSPERYNWLRQLRQSITDVFDGFFSPQANP
jgi:hypothetical protein